MENGKITSEMWDKKLLKEGIIRIGDIHYTTYEFENLLKNSKIHK